MVSQEQTAIQPAQDADHPWMWNIRLYSTDDETIRRVIEGLRALPDGDHPGGHRYPGL